MLQGLEVWHYASHTAIQGEHLQRNNSQHRAFKVRVGSTSLKELTQVYLQCVGGHHIVRLLLILLEIDTEKQQHELDQLCAPLWKENKVSTNNTHLL